MPDNKFLPYNLQFIVLSEFFRLNPAPNEFKKEKLRQWFWVTSFVGLDTPNASKTGWVIDEMKKFAKSDETDFQFKMVDFSEEAQPFPNRFNLISARVRAYVLFLLSLDPKSLNGESFNPDDALKLGYKALPYIISRGGRLSNRILLGSVKKYGFAKKALKNKKNLFEDHLTSEVLASHGITQEALNAIQNGNDELFLELREKELIRIEREFMVSKGVVPNASLDTSEPLNDTE